MGSFVAGLNESLGDGQRGKARKSKIEKFDGVVQQEQEQVPVQVHSTWLHAFSIQKVIQCDITSTLHIRIS